MPAQRALCILAALQDGGQTLILEHELELPADFYIPVDDTSIPLGEIRPVSGAMDLRAVASIADHGILNADQGMQMGVD
mgnify:CR=1 FL=1|jgi:hypothetical protein